MRRYAALVVGASLAASTASAQDRTAEVDRIFSAVTPSAPGCAVGASQNGTTVVNRSYGLADVGSATPISDRTRFDIGSTQKQFVAAAILRLVEDGRLALTDDIRKHVPELPDYGHTITIDHLLTHTSGLRDWTGILPMAEEGTDVLDLIVRQRGLNFAPGTQWSYSNSGYVLAKEIVARVSGMSFAEFARTRLFEPLGMNATAYVPDVLQGGANVALAYQKNGDSWTRFMRLGNERGGGAIISTTGDLLKWNDALTNNRLGSFVTRKLQEEVRLANGRTVRYARGLMPDDAGGVPVVSHSGGAAGYSTWLGRFPAHNLSLAVMCNYEPVSATGYASQVANLFLPAPAASPVAAALAKARTATAGVDLAPMAGLYFSEQTGEPLRLAAAEGGFSVANGPRLVAVAPDRFKLVRPAPFFRSQDDVELRFPSAGVAEFVSTDGSVERYRRPTPYAHTPADLAAFEGRYRSEDLGSTLEVVPAANGIVLRFVNEPEKALELTPAARDTYIRSLMVVRFVRDAAGRVAGFDYSNPLVRSIRFTRTRNRPAGATAGAGGAAAGSATNADALPVTKAPAVSGEPQLQALTGEYEIGPGRRLAITLENGRLHGTPPGGQKRSLTFVSGTTYAADDASGVTLTFTVGAGGVATAALMRQNGREMTLRKVR